MSLTLEHLYEVSIRTPHRPIGRRREPCLRGKQATSARRVSARVLCRYAHVYAHRRSIYTLDPAIFYRLRVANCSKVARGTPHQPKRTEYYGRKSRSQGSTGCFDDDTTIHMKTHRAHSRQHTAHTAHTAHTVTQTHSRLARRIRRSARLCVDGAAKRHAPDDP
jgi:hypothetical protein